MAGTMRLSYDGTDIDLSPIEGYHKTRDHNRIILYTLDKTPYLHSWGYKYRFVVPVNNISSADATNIISWYDNARLCTFSDDQDAGTPPTYGVYIVTDDQPLQMWFDSGTFQDLYIGTLLLHEA